MATPAVTGAFSGAASLSGTAIAVATSNTVTVNTGGSVAMPGAITSSSPQCAGTGITFTKGDCPEGTCYWVSSVFGTETSNSDPTFTTVTSVGNYNVWVRAFNGTCWSDAVTATGNVNASPAITSQPGNQSVAPGAGIATFTVTASVDGLTYQWQEFISSWNDVINDGVYTGATSASLVITNPPLAMNGHKYRCTVSGTCPPTPLTSNGNATLTVELIYCTPTYAYGGTTDFVTQVTLGTLSQATSANTYPYYLNYTATQNAIPDLLSGSNNNLSLTFSADANQYNGVWIDFNQNGVFDASEFFTSNTNAGASGTATVVITVPADATLGIIRMRIRGGDDNQPSATQACGASNSSYGQSQDYWVNIAAPLAITGTATNASCPGVNDGAVDILVAGGNPGYLFNWSNGATTEDISNLSTGEYTVTVTDVNSSTATGTWTVGETSPVCANITVTGNPNTTVCYDALSVITVAGSGTTFIVQPSGNATFIAGEKILFKEGASVLPGGYMLGKITLDGQFCVTPPITAALTTGKDDVQFSTERSFFTLYPNPTNGNFTLVQKGDQNYGNVKVEVYSMSGEKVLTERFDGLMNREFDFGGMSGGLYFVKVIADDYVETIKLVKTR